MRKNNNFVLGDFITVSIDHCESQLRKWLEVVRDFN